VASKKAFFTAPEIKFNKFNKAKAAAEIAGLDLKQLQAAYLELSEDLHDAQEELTIIQHRLGQVAQFAYKVANESLF
jgi:hypothetical protein